MDDQYALFPPTESMTLGNGQVVFRGSRVRESKQGFGTVKSFYSVDNIYCLDIEFDSGHRGSYHPSMFPNQFLPLDEDPTQAYSELFE